MIIDCVSEHIIRSVTLWLCIKREPLPCIAIHCNNLFNLVLRRHDDRIVRSTHSPVRNKLVGKLVRRGHTWINHACAGIVSLIGQLVVIVSTIDVHQHEVAVVAAEVHRAGYTNTLCATEGGQHVLRVAAQHAVNFQLSQDGHRVLTSLSHPIGHVALAGHIDKQRVVDVLHTGEEDGGLVAADGQSCCHSEGQRLLA